MSDRITDLLRLMCPFLALLCLPVTVLAQSGGSPSEPWYKIATGVIAIPAALVGLIFSYRLLRKTNLEARKLELEIQEKQERFQSATESEGLQALKELVDPAGINQRFSILIVRFIILELTLRLWNFIPFVVNSLLTFATTSLFFVATPESFDTDPRSITGVTVLLAPRVVRMAFDIVYWVIVFGFGWPLLKDAGHVMGISFSGIFDLPFFWKRKKKREA